MVKKIFFAVCFIAFIMCVSTTAYAVVIFDSGEGSTGQSAYGVYLYGNFVAGQRVNFDDDYCISSISAWMNVRDNVNPDLAGCIARVLLYTDEDGNATPDTLLGSWERYLHPTEWFSMGQGSYSNSDWRTFDNIDYQIQAQQDYFILFGFVSGQNSPLLVYHAPDTTALVNNGYIWSGDGVNYDYYTLTFGVPESFGVRVDGGPCGESTPIPEPASLILLGLGSLGLLGFRKK